MLSSLKYKDYAMNRSNRVEEHWAMGDLGDDVNNVSLRCRREGEARVDRRKLDLLCLRCGNSEMCITLEKMEMELWRLVRVGRHANGYCGYKKRGRGLSQSEVYMMGGHRDHMCGRQGVLASNIRTNFVTEHWLNWREAKKNPISTNLNRQRYNIGKPAE